MTASYKVVWSEGMFLRPQHFQEQDNYYERYIDSRCRAVGAYYWGLQEVGLDTDLLKLGKIGLRAGTGVFPDGTPFNFPNVDTVPPILQIPDNTSNAIVYLCLPLKRQGSLEIAEGADQQSLARYISRKQQTRSNTSDDTGPAEIQVGKLNVLLKLDSDDLSGYATIGIARIQEYITDKSVKLDDNYIPPMLECAQSPLIAGLLNELKGLVHQRAEVLSSRLTDSGRSGSAEIADYLLLQVLNRIEPLLHHLISMNGLHPLDCYTELVQMAGELATFTTRSKRPPEFPRYQHDNLREMFSSVFSSLRQCLSTVLEQTAVSLELAERKFGIHVAPITDRSMISNSTFVLAIKADLNADQVRTQFPGQARIAPVEKIRDMISAQLPGVPLRALPVAPRQIPYHAGFTYFELDKTNELWQTFTESGGVAVHVGAVFPGLSMELWSIRD